jgi:hypothetical protein
MQSAYYTKLYDYVFICLVWLSLSYTDRTVELSYDIHWYTDNCRTSLWHPLVYWQNYRTIIWHPLVYWQDYRTIHGIHCYTDRTAELTCGIHWYTDRTAELSYGIHWRIFKNSWFLKSLKFKCAKFNIDLLISWYKTTERIFVKETNQAACLNNTKCTSGKRITRDLATCMKNTALYIFMTLKYWNDVTHLHIRR